MAVSSAWIFLLSLSLSHQNVGGRDEACRTVVQADIVFLVDGSRSVSQTSFTGVKDFISAIVSSFKGSVVGSEGVRFGVTVFGDVPRMRIALTDYGSLEEVLRAIRDLPHEGGSRRIGDALQFLIDQVFSPAISRDHAPKIAALITNGHSDDPVDAAARAVADNGISLFAVGVGGADESELRMIVSEPQGEHLLLASDYSLLETVRPKLSRRVCVTASEPPRPVKTSQPVEVRVVGPRDLQVSELAHSSLRLTWSQATSDVTGYRLLVTPLSAKGHLLPSQQRRIDLKADVSSTLVTDLSPKTAYSLTVYAIYPNLIGDSATITVQTTPLPQVSNFRVIEQGLFSLRLGWTPPLGKLDGFKIFIPRSNRRGFAYEHLLPGDTSSHVIDGLEEYKKYIISIYAIYPQGPSEPVSVVGKTLKLIEVEQFLVQNATTDTVQARWASVKGATGYRLTWESPDGHIANINLGDTFNFYMIQGLHPGHEYTITINPIFGDTEGPITTVKVKTLESSAVQTLEVSAVSTSAAVISWNSVPGATGYRLAWGPTQEFIGRDRPRQLALNSSTTEHHLKNVAHDTEYVLTLYVLFGAVVGPGISATFRTSPLGYVSNFKVTSYTSTSINVEWSPIVGATEYKLSWNSGDGSPRSHYLDRRVLSHRIEGLNPQTTYTITICAVYGNSEGPGLSLSQLTAAVSDSGTIQAVRGVKVVDVGVNSFTLSWRKIPGVTGYKITWIPFLGGVEKSLVVSAASTTFTIPNLQEGSAYKIQVSSMVGDREGSPVLVTARTLDIPKVTGFAALNTTDSSTVLSWTSVAGVSGYRVTWRHISVLETKTKTLGPGFTSYKISDLLYGRTYYFTIRPLYGEVVGPISTVYQRISGQDPLVTMVKSVPVTIAPHIPNATIAGTTQRPIAGLPTKSITTKKPPGRPSVTGAQDARVTSLRPTTIRAETRPVCGRSKADIVFLVDESSSIGHSNFIKIKDFIFRLATYFPVIGPQNTQMAVVHYSDEPRIEFRLNDFKDRASVLRALRALRYVGGNTRTGKGISYVLQELFQESLGMRQDAAHILVLITDGRAQDNVVPPSRIAHALGVSVLAVGVSNADIDELNKIAAPTNYKNIFFSPTFDDLPTVEREFINSICSEELLSEFKLNDEFTQEDTPTEDPDELLKPQGPCPTQCLKGQKGEKGDGSGLGGLRFRQTPGQYDPFTSSKGETGEKGPPGTDGVPGLPGRPGRTGPPGSAGQRGLPGIPGDMGPSGVPGPKGQRGERGEPGYVVAGTDTNFVPGRKGEPGSSGPPGVPGVSGAPGQPGQRGLPGSPGISVKGDPGEPGTKGLRGKQGLKGDKGEPGRDGIAGLPGPIGIDGMPGVPGQRGEKGDDGVGVQGAQGPRGEPGEKGKKGFKGERGDKGERGEMGPIGPRGPTGLTGPVGLKGDEGPSGPPGDPAKGILGPTGKKGARGDIGPVGPTGPQGIKGGQGDKGEKGSPGFGVPGQRGPKGENGERGNVGLSGKPGSKGLDGSKGDKGGPGLPGNPGEPGLRGKDGERGLPGEPGDRGNRGPLGLPGQPGNQGEKGDPGKPGLIGSDGEKGDKGEPGKPGPPGPQTVAENNILTRLIKGEQGEPGQPGMRGKAGLPGPRGPQGKPGLPAPSLGGAGRQRLDGLPGKPGLKGDHGQKGEPGPRGDKGDQGRFGIAGMPGLPGTPGRPGIDGKRGLSGRDGERGPKGEAGKKGDKGDAGAIGKDGNKGEPGPPGLPGKQVLVTLEGATADVIRQEFPIPMGPPGAAGSPGMRGEKGEIGTKGDKGDAGAPGKSIEMKDIEMMFEAYGIKLPLLKALIDRLQREGAEALQHVFSSEGAKENAVTQTSDVIAEFTVKDTSDEPAGGPAVRTVTTLSGEEEEELHKMDTGLNGSGGKEVVDGDGDGSSSLKMNLTTSAEQDEDAEDEFHHGEEYSYEYEEELRPGDPAVLHEGRDNRRLEIRTDEFPHPADKREEQSPTWDPAQLETSSHPLTSSPDKDTDAIVDVEVSPPAPPITTEEEDKVPQSQSRVKRSVLWPDSMSFMPGGRNLFKEPQKRLSSGAQGYNNWNEKEETPNLQTRTRRQRQGREGMDRHADTEGDVFIETQGEGEEPTVVGGVEGWEKVERGAETDTETGPDKVYGRQEEEERSGDDDWDTEEDTHRGREGEEEEEELERQREREGTEQEGETDLEREESERKRAEMEPGGERGDDGETGQPYPYPPEYFHLKGQPGETGNPGQKGDISEKGQKGEPGIGHRGPEGQAGPPGQKGEPGEAGRPGAQGIQGIRGIAGIQGPPGLRGPPGDPGEPGREGDRGKRGKNGTPGSPGTRGQAGPQGPPGVSGVKGQKGDSVPGEPGARGLAGFPGRKGEKGLPGVKGASGYSGPRGLHGSKGVKGERGLPGVRGERGSMLQIQGPRGVKGSKGDAGERGSPGFDGDKGEKGEDGPPGVKGLKGDAGTKGALGRFGARGPVGQKGDLGEPGINGVMGRNGNHGVNGAKGNKGDLGLQGQKGNQGDRGEPGSPGDKGEKGDKGFRGLPGHTGSPGRNGEKGDMGLPGSPGIPGLNGLTGSKGEKGEGGTNGVNGAEGVKGEKGAAGFPGFPGFKGSAGIPGRDGEEGTPGLSGVRGDKGIKGQKGRRGRSKPCQEGTPGTPGLRGESGALGIEGAKGEKGEPGLSAGEVKQIVTQEVTEKCGLEYKFMVKSVDPDATTSVTGRKSEPDDVAVSRGLGHHEGGMGEEGEEVEDYEDTLGEMTTSPPVILEERGIRTNQTDSLDGGTAERVQRRKRRVFGTNAAASATDRCLEPMSEGACSDYALVWYFHPRSGECRPFVFGGCGGNRNRFSSRQECRSRCEAERRGRGRRSDRR